MTPKIKLSNAMIEAADVMRDELLRQIELLMNAKGGSKKAGELDRLAKIVSDYEDHRDNFCEAGVKIAKPAVSPGPEMEKKIDAAVRAAFKKREMT